MATESRQPWLAQKKQNWSYTQPSTVKTEGGHHTAGSWPGNLSLSPAHAAGSPAQNSRVIINPAAGMVGMVQYSGEVGGWRVRGQTVWHDFPSLRELFVCRHYISTKWLTAPNLVHLALEQTGQTLEAQPILCFLRGCPLLETLLIHSCIRQEFQNPTRHHSLVNLPNLRGLEFGPHEAALIPHLQFPSGVAVGFRGVLLNNVHGYFSPTVTVVVRDILGRIGARCITLAAPPYPNGKIELLIHFEGLHGSLEITAGYAHTYVRPRDAPFGAEGALFSHLPHIESVRELHIVGYSFDDGQEFSHINAAMSSLASISFFRCKGHNLLGLLAPNDPSSPPFPRLERIMNLGPESGLMEIAKKRRDCGVPLKTLVVGRGPGGFEYGHLEDYTELGQLVDDLRIGCATEILEWGIGNEILNTWSASNVPGPVSPDGNLIVPC